MTDESDAKAARILGVMRAVAAEDERASLLDRLREMRAVLVSAYWAIWAGGCTEDGLHMDQAETVMADILLLFDTSHLPLVEHEPSEVCTFVGKHNQVECGHAIRIDDAPCPALTAALAALEDRERLRAQVEQRKKMAQMRAADYRNHRPGIAHALVEAYDFVLALLSSGEPPRPAA